MWQQFLWPIHEGRLLHMLAEHEAEFLGKPVRKGAFCGRMMVEDEKHNMCRSETRFMKLRKVASHHRSFVGENSKWYYFHI